MPVAGVPRRCAARQGRIEGRICTRGVGARHCARHRVCRLRGRRARGRPGLRRQHLPGGRKQVQPCVLVPHRVCTPRCRPACRAGARGHQPHRRGMVQRQENGHRQGARRQGPLRHYPLAGRQQCAGRQGKPACPERPTLSTMHAPPTWPATAGTGCPTCRG